MIGKKRLALVAGSVTAAGAVATLVAGTTFGLFSATPVSSTANTFTTGTVSIGSPAAVDANCSPTNMVPGDQSANYVGTNTGHTNTSLATCEFAVQYTGSAPAYIGLSTARNGVGTVDDELKWEIISATTNTEPTQPGAYTTAGAINANSDINPMYVATDAGSGVGGQKTYYFWVDYLLPSSVTDQSPTQGSLTLKVSAVQAGNNGSGVCTQGAQCVGTGIGAWS